MSTLIILLGLFSALSTHAQDPSFSQFYANRIYLNPAFTGIDQGISLTTTYRNQWARVPGGFNTYFVSAEIQYPCLRSGFAVRAYQDTEGNAAFRTQFFGFNYSYTLGFEESNLHFGLGASWVSKSLDWNQLLFSDQLDPVFGATDPITGALNPTAAIPIDDQQNFFDADFGVLYRFDTRLRKKGRRTIKMRNSVGLALHHLPSIFGNGGADESLQGLETFVPTRITFHAGSMIPLKVFSADGQKDLYVSPNFKVDLQSKIEVVTYGFYIIWQGMYLGSFFQNRLPYPDTNNTNALILNFGGEIDNGGGFKLAFGYSYDANLSGLRTSAGGTHEFTVRMNFSNVNPCGGGLSSKRGQGRFLDCKSFF
ncbi:MAG: PorP/SprF family type IX secretion system membrane protein [Bacteroidota bacterium]